MILGLSAALAQPMVVRVPFPTSRMYDAPDRVCLQVSDARTLNPTVVDDGHFEATCGSDAGVLSLCLTLQERAWPERIAPLECEGDDVVVRVRPVPAFDPLEDVWDGVRIARNVSVVQATFRVDGVPDAPGLLAEGACGVRDGQLWVKTRPVPRRQECRVVLPDGERTVPIVLVNRLSPEG
ncbi:MAG: hypothetical protein R3F61_24250 [Myxococcota bacterium]